MLAAALSLCIAAGCRRGEVVPSEAQASPAVSPPAAGAPELTAVAAPGAAEAPTAVPPGKALPDKPADTAHVGAAPVPGERTAEPGGQGASTPKTPERSGDLFATGERALAAEDFPRAAQFFERAIAKDPGAEQAYYKLALCRESLGDREGALAVYDRLAKMSGKSRWERLARSRSEALKRGHGRDLLYRAACLGVVGQWRLALEPLGRAVGLSLPPALDQRARLRYYQAVAHIVADSVVGEAAALEAQGLAIADLAVASPEFEAEARYLGRLIRAAVSARAAFPMGVTRPTEPLGGELEAEALGDAGDGYEPVLAGAFGHQIALRLMARAPTRALLAISFARQGAVPPVPSGRLWQALPESPPEQEGFDIEVWADKETASTEGRVPVAVRPSRDSFVAVYKVSGAEKIEQVFPSDGSAMAFVRSGETLRVVPWPAKGSPDMGPVGVVGFWAVATTTEVRVQIDGLPGIEAARRIRERVLRLPADRWRASSFGIRVREPASAPQSIGETIVGPES